jgi:hypothetical protein
MTAATPVSIIANGLSNSVIKMQARDLNGVNLTSGGATVVFTNTAGPNALGTLSSTTDNGDGTYQATLTSPTNLGTATITARLSGTNIASIGTATNSPSLTVNFVAGPVSATASTAVANPTNAAADGLTASTITITAMDDYGHPLTNQVVTLNVSGSGNSVSGPTNTGANGQTTATLTSTVTETKTITVTIGSTQLIAQPTVIFDIDGVSAVLSTAVATPNSGLVADGVATSTITVTAINGRGLPMSGQTVTLSATGSGNILTQPASPTDVNGQVTATLQSTVLGTKTVTVNISGTVINAQPAATFVPGAAAKITFTPGPVTTPVGMTLPAVVVQIQDQLGNPVPQSGTTVTLTLSAGTLSGTNPQLTDANGKATFSNLSITPISTGLYLTAAAGGFSPIQSSLFDVPPKTFYKLNNISALNLPASWTATKGGIGPAGPPAADGVGVWDSNAGSGNIDLGASATWYGLVYAGPAVNVTDTNGGGGHTLTLGAGSLDGSAAVHSLALSNNLALGADQTWKWTSNTFNLTVAGSVDNGGHTLTINGLNGNGPEKFFGPITGTGGLTLISNAAVTLSGTNTYTGNTAVNGGKLIIGATGSLANSQGIALASGTTFDISAASPFTVNNGQTLSGGTIGTGNVTIPASTTNGPGALVLASGSQAAFTAVGNANSNSVTVGKLTVQGGVSLYANPLTVNVTGVPLPSGAYTLITATNGFASYGSLPTPTITGQGLAGGSIPQLVVNGQNLQLLVGFSVSPAIITNNCLDSATFTATPAPGATSYQWYDPSLQPITDATNTTLILNSTHPSDSGTYSVVATGSGWTLTNSAVLFTTDTAPPLITLNGSSTVFVPVGGSYTELGATALDTCPGTSLTVSITGSVDASTLGEYDITYSATTGAGTPGSATRTVNVIDPVLRNLSISSSSATPQCGSNVTFTAAADGLPPIAYQWYDNNTNAIPDATNSTYTLVAPTDSSAGTYTVVAQNSYGPPLTNTTTIIAVLHTAPPIFTLNGVNPVTLLLNTPYSDAGATAYDLCAQASLTVTSNSMVNTSAIGTYTVTYSATTADGTPGTLIRTVIVSTVPDFGPNVLIFDPTMTNIQSQINAVFTQMKYNQFGTNRYALCFKPGQYPNLDIPVGFYTEVLGLGQMPDDVTIPCYLHSDGILVNENATMNFWRSVENVSISPTNSADYMMWAVSQGTGLRRIHIQGNISLANFTDGNWSSGGFMADSKVDNTISTLSQQQWLSRNDNWGSWNGGVWNMVFVGISNPPAGTWPTKVYTTVTNTPLIAEKPYLYLDSNGNYAVMVPALQTNSVGITWANGPTPATSIPIGQFYVAHSDTDSAASINAALNAGLNLILTPGYYQLSSSILVTRPDTIILGLGYPTLVPQTAAPALVVSDVDGVKVAGLVFDAGPVQTPALMQVGTAKSSIDHSRDPIFLYDIFMRVGGTAVGKTVTCLQINANDVVGDNFWLWRADHGNGVGWTQNTCANGLVVNGDRVTTYGLFVEHEQQYQTLWNGNWGRVYMYQSELPYDPPSQAAWSHDGINGYASYKVADSVTSHQGYGIGVYAVFIDSTNISCFNAIETPTNSQQVNMHDLTTVYIGGNVSGNGSSTLDHIINGTGATLVGPNFGSATANTLWPNPTFSIGAGVSGSNAAITLPTESWHAYQIQYKNSLTDPWSNLGAAFGGNDTLQTIKDPNPPTTRLYRVGSF